MSPVSVFLTQENIRHSVIKKQLLQKSPFVSYLLEGQADKYFFYSSFIMQPKLPCSLKNRQNSAQIIHSGQQQKQNISFLVKPKSHYFRFKQKLSSSNKGISLQSIETNRQSISSRLKPAASKRILSHRKLISSDLEHKQSSCKQQTNQRVAMTDRKKRRGNSEKNLTQRSLSSRKNILQEIYGKNLKVPNKNQGSIGLKIHSTITSKKNLHINKFTKYRNDKLNTIDGDNKQQVKNDQNRQKDEKKNMIKGCIEHLQAVLKELDHPQDNIQKKQYSLSHRLKTETTKKASRNPLNQISSINNQLETINPKSQLKGQLIQKKQQTDENSFVLYLQQMRNNKNDASLINGKKDQKIIIKKNRKKSNQNISLSRLQNKLQSQGMSSKESALTSRAKIVELDPFMFRQSKNTKQIFRHVKKYDLRLKSDLPQTVNESAQNIEEIIQLSPTMAKKPALVYQDQSKQIVQLSSPCQKFLMMASDPVDCSSIQQTNQSSFISQAGKNTLMKQFQKKVDLGSNLDFRGIRKTLEYHKNGSTNRSSSKRSLLKLNKKANSNFPNDFF